jgi:ABC-type phosphate/phosphonate transport system substrate-binding protein
MIVALPMYDWPELHQATDAFWQAIRVELANNDIDAPAQLSRNMKEEDTWLAPDLLLGQTCGYPYSTMLKDKVRYVATPVYRVEGCEAGRYSSAIVVNRDSHLNLEALQGTSLAFNATMSLSGYRILGAMFGDLQDFFGPLIKSNGHRQSARLVANGKADVAALDAVCWHHLCQFEPKTAEKLKILGWTDKNPALPFITSLNTSDEVVAHLRTALNKVTAAKEIKKVCEMLTIDGCEIIDQADYAQLSRL